MFKQKKILVILLIILLIGVLAFLSILFAILNANNTAVSSAVLLFASGITVDIVLNIDFAPLTTTQEIPERPSSILALASVNM